MSFFARKAYHLVLRLHPRDFRIEFGDEMLWIFDEEMHCEERWGIRFARCARLLTDVVRSAFTQRILREAQQPKVFAIPFDHLNSSGAFIQAEQWAFLVMSLVFSVFGIFLSGKLVICMFRELFRLF
jgi:hypothetical protein